MIPFRIYKGKKRNCTQKQIFTICTKFVTEHLLGHWPGLECGLYGGGIAAGISSTSECTDLIPSLSINTRTNTLSLWKSKFSNICHWTIHSSCI